MMDNDTITDLMEMGFNPLEIKALDDFGRAKLIAESNLIKSDEVPKSVLVDKIGRYNNSQGGVLKAIGEYNRLALDSKKSDQELIIIIHNH